MNKKKQPQQKKRPDIGLFDFLRGMTQQKRRFDFSDPSVEKSYNPFIVERFLLSIPHFSSIMSGCLRHSFSLSKENHYNILCDVLPYMPVSFQKPVDTPPSSVIGYIIESFNVSSVDAYSIYEQLSDDDKQCLREEFEGFDGTIV